jgi:putative tryptophan/tyrosine transport system substrate-binding protein
MRRREFMTLVGGVASWPLAVRAQQPMRQKRIAIVGPIDITSGHPGYPALFAELRRLGYVEGRNLAVERYSAEGRTERYAELAASVVRTNPDLILAVTGQLALSFKNATATIPIIASTGDPVLGGIVTNIARPGGNITGISTDAGFDIWGKRLALLLEAKPNLSNVRFFASRFFWETRGETLRELAKHAGISLAGATVDGTIDEAQHRRVFAAMEKDRVDGLVLSDEATFYPNRRVLVELAAKTRIPSVYSHRYYVEPGGLMVYSSDLADGYRRIADQIDKILKGANPGDIPYYLATRYELIINLKTAKALGLTMPLSLLGQADEVIE